MSSPFPPYGNSSLLETWPLTGSFGPGPGIPVGQGQHDGSWLMVPLNQLGVNPSSVPNIFSQDDGYWINYASQTIFNAAVASNFNNMGGTIRLVPGTYQVSTGIVLNESIASVATQPSIPISIIGHGPQSILQPVPNFNNNTVLFKHRQRGYGNQTTNPADYPVGILQGFMIDGTLGMGNSAIGLDIGDGWGHTTRDVTISNFNGINNIGCRHSNLHNFSEKNILELNLLNNTSNLVIDTASGATGSHEYNDYLISMYPQQFQNGISLINGSWCNGCHFRVRGNMQPSASAASGLWASLSLSGTSSDGSAHISESTFDWVLEITSVLAFGPQTINFGGTNNNMQDNQGMLNWQFGGSGWAASNLVASGATFSYTGILKGDSTLKANNAYTVAQVTYP